MTCLQEGKGELGEKIGYFGSKNVPLDLLHIGMYGVSWCQAMKTWIQCALLLGFFLLLFVSFCFLWFFFRVFWDFLNFLKSEGRKGVLELQM